MSAYSEKIDRFEAGGAKLRAGVEGVTSQQAVVRCAPGTWSIQEVVIHLADMDAIAIERVKRVIVEENPPLLNADEQAYVERLHCHAQAIEDALVLFEVGRRQFARVLRQLDDAAFARFGTHSSAGKVTLADLLRIYTDHVDHHLQFIEGKRRRLAGG